MNFYTLTLFESGDGWADELGHWHFKTLEAAKAFAESLSESTAAECGEYNDYRWSIDLDWIECRHGGLQSTHGRYHDDQGEPKESYAHFRLTTHAFRG